METKTIALWGCGAAGGVGILVIGVMAVGSGFAWMGLRGAGPYVPPFAPARVIDADHALFVRQGFEGTGAAPFAVRSVTLDSGVPEKSWEWSHSGQGLDEWSVAGPWIAAKLVSINGGIEAPAYAFHRDHGLAWEASRASEVHLLDRDELLSRSGESISLVRLNEKSSTVAWSAPVPAGAYVGFYGWTEDRIVIFNDSIGVHVYDRAKGGAPIAMGAIQAMAGLSRARSEAIVLRDGRLVVMGLDGTERTTLDLDGGKRLTDSMRDPCLFGRSGGEWIFVYTTGLDETTTSNGRSWVRPAERMLAAVDADSGEVRWRLPVGQWPLECYLADEITVDVELPDGLLVMGARDREADPDLDGMVGYVDLSKGAFVWQRTFERTARSPLLLSREDDSAWLHLVDGDRPVLARFHRGRLTGAAKLASFTSIRPDLVGRDTAWLSVRQKEESGWLRVSGDDVAQTAGELDQGREDGRAWVLDNLRLPEAAR